MREWFWEIVNGQRDRGWESGGWGKRGKGRRCEREDVRGKGKGRDTGKREWMCECVNVLV